jgi:hypothetical protein
VKQEFIEMLNPTYNNYRAKGLDIERAKERVRKALRKYYQTEKCKEVHRKYSQSERGKECQRKYQQKLCLYNGETLTFNALIQRFYKASVLSKDTGFFINIY